VKTAADEQVVEMALIENIQREDLNAIEIALTFYRLMEEYKLTQERLSERVGKNALPLPITCGCCVCPPKFNGH